MNIVGIRERKSIIEEERSSVLSKAPMTSGEGEEVGSTTSEGGARGIL